MMSCTGVDFSWVEKTEGNDQFMQKHVMLTCYLQETEKN
jgi:hypothetical protein